MAAKMRPTASGFRPLAPRPYTVSVGMPSRPPRRRISAASAVSRGCSLCVCNVLTFPMVQLLPMELPMCFSFRHWGGGPSSAQYSSKRVILSSAKRKKDTA